ncbi:hypothetical protein BB560_005469 [Smittium megazygosporum]|uniref:Kinesin motor domain-containing protein n=1 Tax=Smittium megazygosporum TaxID=133381 RepID=A0A2T9Z504_9FUNG|nr:hypothetical protein BB560_005469 [Smittium megazygosporum]
MVYKPLGNRSNASGQPAPENHRMIQKKTLVNKRTPVSNDPMFGNGSLGAYNRAGRIPNMLLKNQKSQVEQKVYRKGLVSHLSQENNNSPNIPIQAQVKSNINTNFQFQFGNPINSSSDDPRIYVQTPNLDQNLPLDQYNYNQYSTPKPSNGSDYNFENADDGFIDLGTIRDQQNKNAKDLTQSHSKSIFGGLLSGVSSFFAGKSSVKEVKTKDFGSIPSRKIVNQSLNNKYDVMNVPVSKTPYTNHKTIEKYNPKHDPIEAFLRFRPAALSKSTGLVPLGKSVKSDYVTDVKMNVNSDGSIKNERLLFTGILQESVCQENVYQIAGSKIVNDLFDEKNSLLFAYGVTGSGKTFTMQGTPESPGLIFRTLSDVIKRVRFFNSSSFFCDDTNKGVIINGISTLKPKYATQVEWCSDQRVLYPKFNPVPDEQKWINAAEKLAQKEEGEASDLASEYSETDDLWRYSLYISYYEVYNENIYDLIDMNTLCVNGSSSKENLVKKVTKNRKPLTLRSEGGKGVNTFIEGLAEVRVESIEQLVRVLLHAQSKRVVYSTSANTLSSRSHAICMAKVVKWKTTEKLIPGLPIPVSAESKYNTLLLADLAGSERAKNTNNVGERLIESNKINVSLMVLKRCMDVLRFNTEVSPEQAQIVPYNESKLTRVFQPSLEGGAKTVMIACIDPNQISGKKNFSGRSETLNVIEFAHVASTITLHDPSFKPRKQLRKVLEYISPTKTKQNRSTTSLNQLEDEISSNKEEKNEDSHIELEQLINATNSIKSPKTVPIDSDEQVVRTKVKRTVDAMVQTEDFKGVLDSDLDSQTLKKQKISSDGSWKAIDVSTVFKEVKKNPSRRRSFPEISEFVSNIETEVNVGEQNRSQPLFIRSDKNDSITFSNDSLTMRWKNSVLDKQAQSQREGDQKEIKALKLAVVQLETKIAKLNSEKSVENTALISYAKELKEALVVAQQSLAQANQNGLIIESKVRQELTEFYMQQIEKIQKRFSQRIEAHQYWSDEKSSEKVEILLNYFGNPNEKEPQTGDVKQFVSSNSSNSISKQQGEVQGINYPRGAEGNRKDGVESLKNIIKNLENKNRLLSKEYENLRENLETYQNINAKQRDDLVNLHLSKELNPDEIISFDDFDSAKVNIDMFSKPGFPPTETAAFKHTQGDRSSQMGLNRVPVAGENFPAFRESDDMLQEKSKFSSVMNKILNQLTPQSKSGNKSLKSFDLPEKKPVEFINSEINAISRGYSASNAKTSLSGSDSNTNSIHSQNKTIMNSETYGKHRSVFDGKVPAKKDFGGKKTNESFGSNSLIYGSLPGSANRSPKIGLGQKLDDNRQRVSNSPVQSNKQTEKLSPQSKVFSREASFVLRPNVTPHFLNSPNNSNSKPTSNINSPGLQGNSMRYYRVSNASRSGSLLSYKSPNDFKSSVPDDLLKYQYSFNAPLPTHARRSSHDVPQKNTEKPARRSSFNDSSNNIATTINAIYGMNNEGVLISSFPRSSSLSNSESFPNRGRADSGSTMNRVIHSKNPSASSEQMYAGGKSNSVLNIDGPAKEAQNSISQHKGVRVVSSEDTIPLGQISDGAREEVNKLNISVPGNKISESTLSNEKGKNTKVEFEGKGKGNKKAPSVFSSILNLSSGSEVNKTAKANESKNEQSSKKTAVGKKVNEVKADAKKNNDRFLLSPLRFFSKLRSRK